MILQELRLRQTEKDKILEEWLKSLYENYYEKLKIYNKEKPELVVSKLLFSSGYLDSPYEKIICFPRWLVRASKKEKNQRLYFYSGKNFSIPYNLELKYTMAHEISHHFYKFWDFELNEGVADKIAAEFTQNEPLGKDYLCLKISRFLVQANDMRLIHCKEIDKIKLPYEIRFEDKHYEMMQLELDYYFKKQKKVSKGIQRIEKLLAFPLFTPPSVYTRGFVKLMDNPGIVSQFLDSINNSRSRNFGFMAN